MNEIGEKYLPMGTVVLLKGGTKRVMIAGFCSMEVNNQEKIWDYSGYMYPEGFMSEDEIFLFNHTDIEEVFHIGLINEEEKEFKTALVEAMNEYEKTK